MTLHRIEHAVVIDTDDIPGRGGYAVVGVSDGVLQAERVLVAHSFGISDFLHDPQNQRSFYSFFRVPGGQRHAFVRRFAKGHRRNQTQNSLCVHTLFLDDALFDALRGLPWLLINVLSDDVPGLVPDAPLPPLEIDLGEGVVDSVSQRLTKRLEVIDRQLGATAVASVLTMLAKHGRVQLPQGVVHEQLTMLAWSMLPWPDRQSIAWTQHDARNIAGVDFAIANAPEGMATRLEDAAGIPARLVAIATSSDEERGELDYRTAKYGLTIRKIDEIESWLAWRDELRNVRENIGLESLKRLAGTARARHKDPWIDGEEVLQILWSNVTADAADVQRWAHLLRDSGLHAIIFRQPPAMHWLDRAAKDVGADLLVRFFLFGSDAEPAAAPVRDALARWVLARSAGVAPADVAASRAATRAGARDAPASAGVDACVPDTLARLALRLALDHAASYNDILELLLKTDAGLVAAHDLTPARAEFGAFAFDVAEIAMREKHEHASAFVADVLVPHLDLSPQLGKRIDADFAKEVATLLRTKPESYVRFAAHLPVEIESGVNDTITKWVLADPARNSALGRTILPRIRGADKAAPLTFALARAGEPARAWFGVLVERAAALDTRGDRKAAQEFRDQIARLEPRMLQLEGALDLLVLLLERAAASELRIGDCVRALILLLRPAWKESPVALIGAVTTLVQQTKLAGGWERVLEAIAEDFGHSKKIRHRVALLVVEFWRTVDPLQVPELDDGVIATIDTLDDESRQRLASEWQTRLRRLPESRATDIFMSLLFPKRGGTPKERIAFRQREIDQGISSHDTLNGLEKDLHDAHADVADAMSDAIVRHVKSHGRVRRIERYLDLLDAWDVSPTVKRIIESRLLPKALDELKSSEWNELATQSARVFARGVVTMSFGYALGIEGPTSAQRAFESACRANRRLDGLQALREGQRRRGALQWVMRKMRMADGALQM